MLEKEIKKLIEEFDKLGFDDQLVRIKEISYTDNQKFILHKKLSLREWLESSLTHIAKVAREEEKERTLKILDGKGFVDYEDLK